MYVADRVESEWSGRYGSAVMGYKTILMMYAVLPFSKLNKMFVGYFNPQNIFLDNKNK